jgi:tetratricopeptide (TPR) repeat protein
MKNSSFTVPERNTMRRSSLLIALVLLIATALLMQNRSFADEFPFMVLLENVPGTAEIEGGKMQAGIKMLQDQLRQVEQEKSGDIWSTLCAAYIVTASLNQAERACNKAVEIDPTYHAMNNLGVFHVHKGALSKAREDFERVRPVDVDAYLELLKTKDARLVAASNLNLIDKLLAEHSHTDAITSNVMSPAAIEDLSN